MRQREDGCCYAYSKDGSAFALPRAEYARLRQEWMGGRSFWTGPSFYDSVITIKLADIVAVSDTTALSMAMQRADSAEDDREDVLV